MYAFADLFFPWHSWDCAPLFFAPFLVGNKKPSANLAVTSFRCYLMLCLLCFLRRKEGLFSSSLLASTPFLAYFDSEVKEQKHTLCRAHPCLARNVRAREEKAPTPENHHVAGSFSLCICVPVPPHIGCWVGFLFCSFLSDS